MVGFLCFLVLMVPPLGLLMPLRVLAYLVEVALGWLFFWFGCSVEYLLMGLMKLWLPLLCLIILMSGQMAALFLIILLVFPLQDLGFFAHQAEHFWGHRRWGHVDGVRLDPDLACCKGFCSVPGPLQSVQRAEMWGVIFALQISRAVHLGVDNLGVVRHVGRLLDGCRGPEPFELVNDGDLL